MSQPENNSDKKTEYSAENQSRLRQTLRELKVLRIALQVVMLIVTLVIRLAKFT